MKTQYCTYQNHIINKQHIQPIEQSVPAENCSLNKDYANYLSHKREI